MYKVAIVEDDANIRAELKILLENALYDVILIEEFDQADDKLLKAEPDLVLLDVNLPNISGFQICTKLRKSSNVPIIFVTSRNTSMDELNCITLGGDDYIAKPYNAPVLLARIASILKRSKKDLANEAIQLMYKGLILDVPSATVKYKDQVLELSRNELKILYYLLKHTESFVPRAELIDYLWDNQVFIDDNALSVNVTRIRSKLNDIGMEDFIKTKRGLGYKI